MKSKGKIQTLSTTIINDSYGHSLYSSKDISFNDIKKEYINKYSSGSMTRKQKSRAINSLDELTKKFVRCVGSSESDRINLNTVMKKIKAKKRRIYDITNVLEGIFKYLLYTFLFIIGIGFIKKDSKNQIRLKPEFYNLFNDNQNSIIELDEDKNKNYPNAKNKAKLIELSKINNEINFVNSLLDSCNEKLLLFREKNQNININYDNNLNKKNINKNKSINLFAISHDAVMTPEPSIDEIINILYQNNLYIDNKNNEKNEFKLKIKQIHENKENLSPNKNYENVNSLFNEEYIDLFNKDNNNNVINLKSLKNKNLNFNLAKDSLFSDISSFGDLGDFNYDKEKLFE